MSGKTFVEITQCVCRIRHCQMTNDKSSLFSILLPIFILFLFWFVHMNNNACSSHFNRWKESKFLRFQFKLPLWFAYNSPNQKYSIFFICFRFVLFTKTMDGHLYSSLSDLLKQSQLFWCRCKFALWFAYNSLKQKCSLFGINTVCIAYIDGVVADLTVWNIDCSGPGTFQNSNICLE